MYSELWGINGSDYVYLLSWKLSVRWCWLRSGFPSPIKSNLISDSLIFDQLDVLNWSLINCVLFFHAIHNLLIQHQLSLLYASLIGWQWPQFAVLSQITQHALQENAIASKRHHSNDINDIVHIICCQKYVLSQINTGAVSYTHLTLPTNREV